VRRWLTGSTGAAVGEFTVYGKTKLKNSLQIGKVSRIPVVNAAMPRVFEEQI
jgi:hypothetical protein